MNGLDYTILGVIGISAVVGLMRGFVRETVSLLVWIAAFWLAMTYSVEVAPRLSGMIDNPSLRMAAAFVALFVSVLIIGVIVNYLLASLLSKAGLRTSDRVLGVLFGMARGVLVVALVVVLVEMTPLVESDSWQGSTIVAFLQPMLVHFQKFVPADLHVEVTQGLGGFSR